MQQIIVHVYHGCQLIQVLSNTYTIESYIFAKELFKVNNGITVNTCNTT